MLQSNPKMLTKSLQRDACRRLLQLKRHLLLGSYCTPLSIHATSRFWVEGNRRLLSTSNDPFTMASFAAWNGLSKKTLFAPTRKYLFSMDLARYLASSRRQQAPEQGLTNERLVASLVREADAASAEEIQVRMIVQKTEGTTTEVVSLAKAIQTSVDLDHDLIGIALEQEVPVVKVDCLKRLAYKQSRKSSQNKKGQTLPEKEFRFKTGIEDNDLQRKVDNMIKYLDKGHNCQVSIRSTRRAMTKDEDAARIMANKVLDLVSEVGELESKLKVNPSKTFARFLLKPSSTRKKAAT